MRTYPRRQHRRRTMLPNEVFLLCVLVLAIDACYYTVAIKLPAATTAGEHGGLFRSVCVDVAAGGTWVPCFTEAPILLMVRPSFCGIV